MILDEQNQQVLSFSVRGSRPGKTVQMTEAEVRGLCLKSRELFLQQPILLELEAPLKICGEYTFEIFKILPSYAMLWLCMFIILSTCVFAERTG